MAELRYESGSGLSVSGESSRSLPSALFRLDVQLPLGRLEVLARYLWRKDRWPGLAACNRKAAQPWHQAGAARV